MTVATDQTWMGRALGLAMRGRGQVEPNPMVGCVLVRDGAVVGEGYHARVGGPHAEPTALADCSDRGNSPRGSTAYVTLEPCCHLNKRTPPCVPALISAGVARVVIGCLDPNPAVNGEGVRQLRAAGIAVDTGSREAEARQLIAPFLARTVLSRPYVTVKWAQDIGGHIAGPGGARRQISGPSANAAVHRLRSRVGAIVIGGQSLRADDPLLTARLPEGPAARQPMRVILTRTGELPPTARLMRPSPPEGGEVRVYRVPSPAYAGLAAVMRDLWDQGVGEVLVESGGSLAESLAAEGLVDRYWVLRSKVVALEPGSLPATGLPAGEHWVPGAEVDLGEDVLIEAWDRRSAVLACPVPSADLEELRSPARP